MLRLRHAHAREHMIQHYNLRSGTLWSAEGAEQIYLLINFGVLIAAYGKAEIKPRSIRKH